MTKTRKEIAKPNELFDFMQQITTEMANEYVRIQKRALEDPGTAGDEGEGNWAALLRDWLPGNYHVATKGRILHHDGVAGPQVDVIVLQPEYPRSLRDKKLYLAGGVVAVFECKLTLRAQHIRRAVENASEICRHVPKRHGTPYRELYSPIFYGLLAHSHSWRARGSNPLANVTTALQRAIAPASTTGTPSLETSNRSHETKKHPRELLDLICVSDLATWSIRKMPFIGQSIIKDWQPMVTSYGLHGSVPIAYACYSREAMEHHIPNAHHREQYRSMTPVGSLLSALIQRIGWENPLVRPLADYFRLTGLEGFGSGKPMLWQTDVYTPETRKRVEAGKLSRAYNWDEWSLFF